jgi:hypothetical protein
MASLNSDLKTSIQTYQDLKNDDEGKHRAFANTDSDMLSLVGRDYDKLFKTRYNEFRQQSNWALFNIPAGDRCSSSEDIEETMKTLSSKFAFDGSFLEKDDPVVDIAYFLTVGNIKSSLSGEQQIKVIEHFEKAKLALPLSKFGDAEKLVFGDN